MASVHVYDSLKSHLQTEFSGVYAVLDFDTIDPDIQQGEDNFISIEEIPGTEDRIAIGEPDNVCHREAGTLIVHCFVPAPESSSIARQMADTVRDTLRIALVNGVRIIGVAPPDIGAANNGLWTVAGFPINYEYDFTGQP